jgi:hypothetical protein
VAVEEADAYPVAGLPGGHPGADGIDDADDLVARHDRRSRIGTHAFDRKEARVADPIVTSKPSSTVCGPAAAFLVSPGMVGWRSRG